MWWLECAGCRQRSRAGVVTGLLLTTTLVFAALAVLSPRLVHTLTMRHRIRRPHRALLLVFRAWFAVLAAATFWLLLSTLHTGR